MADGTFAVLTLLFGLYEMHTQGCEGGCLAPRDTQPRLEYSVGEVLERRARPGNEIYLRYAPGRGYGPYDTAYGLSIGEEGALWLGAGPTYTLKGGSFYGQLHLMPGLYAPVEGFDLGGALAFRSGIEFGYEMDSGWRIALGYDHRSNAELHEENPGVETLQFRVSRLLD